MEWQIIGALAAMIGVVVNAVSLALKARKNTRWLSAAFLSGMAVGAGVTLLIFLDKGSVKHSFVGSVFADPIIDGYRLDRCLSFGDRCGEPAATGWCKKQGYDYASEFVEDTAHPGITTKLISGQICKQPFCTAFESITCVKDVRFSTISGER